MTEMKSRSWMDDWTSEQFEEYCQAWHDATDSSDDSGERSREFLRLILDAEQAHRTWAEDVLADMQRRGALSAWKDAPVVPAISNKKGKRLTTRAAAKRRGPDGVTPTFVQDSLFDMARAELSALVDTGYRMSATHRAKAQLCERLIELVDRAGGACTPREAAVLQGVDLEAWCAA